MDKTFSDSQRDTIWRKYFGNNPSGTDAFGRPVTFQTFEADHIWPVAHGGKTVVENGIPLNSKSNEEKSDDYEGTINGKRFKVTWTGNQVDHGIGILHVNGYKVSK